MPKPTPYLTKYHLAEQNAYALLGPVRTTLQELERRTLHYVERLEMARADQEMVRAAHRALAAARQEVERLHAASAPAPQGTGGAAAPDA